jgi:hypothetical protein
MGAHLKAALEAHVIFDEHDREGPLIDRSGLGSAQNIAGFLSIGTVDDDGLETLTGKAANGIFGVGAVIDADFKVAEDTTQNANRPIVGTYQ